ncbi:MAG: helix-turn-helix transcriptional regulator [Candidatus Omnitrophota bacterium]|jgi:transposase-like protein
MDKELEDWYMLHKFHFYAGNYETKDLAAFLGINSRTIQRWIKETTKPTKDQLAKIKTYLDQKKQKDSL